jgi:transposase-like protein
MLMGADRPFIINKQEYPMKRPRRNHSPTFKARIAKEALKGLKTISEIAQENELHSVQVSKWKKELEERMAEIFERKNAVTHETQDLQVRCERLERKVGQLVIEKEFLEKSAISWGSSDEKENG